MSDVFKALIAWAWRARGRSFGAAAALVCLLAAPLAVAAPPTPTKPKAQAPKAVKPAATPKPTPSRAKTPAEAKKRVTPDPTTGGGASGTASDVRRSDIYGDRLDGLQAEVDALKDKIFRSKARLSLLKETVLRGVLAGSRVILAHNNLMSSTFKLVRIVVTMDGAQIYARTDETGSLDSEDELVVYDGNLPPGPHNITIELQYKGHGYGVFEYLSSTTYTPRASHSFTAPENGSIKVVSVGYERGNLTTELKDRPAVEWQEQELDASGRPLAKTRRGRNGNDTKKK